MPEQISTNRMESYDIHEENTKDSATSVDGKILIHEERLDIKKKLIQLAEVTAYKEVISEDKTIKVPITREELVIEKRMVNGNDSSHNEVPPETIRIPLVEEQIEIVKHPVSLQSVNIKSHEFYDIVQVSEHLKKEKININTQGDPMIKIYNNSNRESDL